MPFEIVRNDITNMQVDAIVNPANPNPAVGPGLDAGIHKKSGFRLLQARKKIGSLSVGQAVITPGYHLDAKYVIHTAGPVWMDGRHREAEQLAVCYRNSLRTAQNNGCESIAFPLISAGNNGFPKELALEIAVREIRFFLLKNEMQIYLVVFGQQEFVLSKNRYQSVASYIDETYMKEKMLDEYGIDHARFQTRGRRFQQPQPNAPQPQPDASCEYSDSQLMQDASAMPYASASNHLDELNDRLKELDAGFSEMLLRLIDRSGKTDSEIYKRANVDRKLFSKIRNNPSYRPSKTTAIAFAFALKLDLDETKDLIGRAGFALSHSSKMDIIVEYFLIHRNYDVFELNEILFAFDQPLIGA